MNNRLTSGLHEADVIDHLPLCKGAAFLIALLPIRNPCAFTATAIHETQTELQVGCDTDGGGLGKIILVF